MSEIFSLGAWIKRRRKALDLTQDELAQRVGCSPETIRKIEADARRPSREIAARLADQLGLVDHERAVFVQAARAALAPDHLAAPADGIPLTTFAPPSAAPAMPSGTVAFLFTDIAGSTHLWEQHPQAMAAVIARHDALLCAIVAAHGGVVFKTIGDSVLAAFATVPQAAAAALAAQRAVVAEPWPLPAPLQVRMALHVGAAELREGDYFGSTLNRAARLLAAGHGGQILLSLATEQLLREQPPPGVALRDLGTYRLRDLSLPEQIFQLQAPDLPADFPALQTLDAHPTNLPFQPTTLIGRAQEIAALTALLRRANVRLVTLTGPGGVGKTRLSLHAAAELVGHFAHGVYLVDLAPIRSPQLVTSAIATTLGLREAGGQPLLTTLKEHLRDRQLLLLLDNFEQVLDAAPLVAELLASAPRLSVLVTSREALHLRGEHEIAVPSLTLPDRATLPPLDQLSQYAAVELFIQRALDTRLDFQITNANAPAVAEICARLDGLPLAIELAAARVRLFTPEMLLARLTSRLALLTGGPRDLPARQQTMRAAIAWSYDLLQLAEQRIFRRLGVFVGGFTLAAAEDVCGDLAVEPQPDLAPSPWLRAAPVVLDGIAALIDKSLLRQIARPDGIQLYVMLETIREYAYEKLVEHHEREELQRRHAAHYLALAEAPEEANSLHPYARLESEHDNLRAALRWAIERPEIEVALRLIEPLGWLWYRRGYWSEGRAWLQLVLPLLHDADRPAARAWILCMQGMLAQMQGETAAGQSLLEQSLALYRQIGDTLSSARVLMDMGVDARERGDVARATAIFEELLRAPVPPDPAEQRLYADGIAWTQISLAQLAVLREDPAAATPLLAAALAHFRAVGVSVGVAWALNHLGHVAQLQDDDPQAAACYRESLTLFAQTDQQGVGWSLEGLGEVALAQGDLTTAAAQLTASLRVFQQLGDPALVWALAGLGSVAALAGEPQRAARLWGAVEALRAISGKRPAPAARATYERAMAAARAELDAPAFAAAWAEGRTRTQAQAIAEALSEAHSLEQALA